MPLAEVAATFRMTPDEVAADLELAAMCGLPPFVDELIDVFIDDDMVFVGVPRLFTKPLRLTAPEGFALVAAGRAAMQLPGADPTSAARPRARQAGRGARRGRRRRRPASVDLAATPMVDEFVAAAKRGRAAAHRATGRRRATRSPSAQITPRRVFHERGEWYVAGRRRPLRRAAHVPHRPHRVGRAHGRASTTPIDDDAGAGLVGRLVGGRLAPAGHVAAPAGGTWVVERYPVDAVDGASTTATVEARFAVASERWLERLLLRLGTDAEVVEPAEWRDLGADARGTRLLRALRSDRSRRVERVEVGLVGDAVAASRWGSTAAVAVASARASWWSVERHAVAGAQVGQAVGELAVGVEPPGQLRACTARRSSTSGDAGLGGRLLEERGVEVGVVGGEHRCRRAGWRSSASASRLPAPRRSERRVMPWTWRGPTRFHGQCEAHERRPLVDHGAVGLDGDDADLQHVVAPGRQPGRLDVDDGEPRRVARRYDDLWQRHDPNLLGGCQLRTAPPRPTTLTDSHETPAGR